MEKRRHQLREPNWHVGEDGSWVLRGRFMPEQGALIHRALESAMDDVHDERKGVPAETFLPRSRPTGVAAFGSRR